MIDRTRPAPGEYPVPAFAPVPRHHNRHDGWTPERQHGFIEALLTTGSVKAAAHAVNMTPEGAYMLRRHPGAASFRTAWDQALAHGVQRLEDIAMDRAINGTEEPVYSYGKIVGTRRVHNDRLLMFLLRNRAPARFAATTARLGADGSRLISAAELDGLKRQWREEWERDTANARPPRDEEDEALCMEDADYLSPRTAILFARWDASANEDWRRGKRWWERPEAQYDDGTRPEDYPDAGPR